MKNSELPLSVLDPRAMARYPASLTYPSATVVALASSGTVWFEPVWPQVDGFPPPFLEVGSPVWITNPATILCQTRSL